MKADPIGSHGEYPRLVFAVPPEVAEEAREGIWYRDEYGIGGTEVGMSRAIQLSTGRPPVTLRDIVVMRSYFARHAGDKIHQMSPPSAGMIAWKLWGGFAGYGWVSDVMSAYDADMQHGEIHYLLDYGKEDRSQQRSGSRSNPSGGFQKERAVERSTRGNPDRISETPLILQSCVVQVVANQGIERPNQDDISRAFAICTASLQRAGRLEPGTRRLTEYGMEKERSYSAKERISIVVAYETMLDIARGGKPKRIGRR